MHPWNTILFMAVQLFSFWSNDWKQENDHTSLMRNIKKPPE